ncbi:hypothetical protein PROFUN_14372 [Planoprotostelium fungivorum]|uniref:Uncharacterized protein n=1 Tax=Planoprotostelium fungivorum TaxID=1890364 RepID=A0A2P6N0E6_9EUKA|nr:hypothetical protein PROFUN_14372 [Planoprotostelium fungivorum]
MVDENNCWEWKSGTKQENSEEGVKVPSVRYLMHHHSGPRIVHDGRRKLTYSTIYIEDYGTTKREIEYSLKAAVVNANRTRDSSSFYGQRLRVARVVAQPRLTACKFELINVLIPN